MSALVPLAFDGQGIRIEIDEAGKHWLCARDVGACLGLQRRSATAATERLDDDEKAGISIATPGGPQEMVFVSISGAIDMTFESRKPEAKRFRRWLRKDVVPEIMETGAYDRRTREERVAAALLDANEIITESQKRLAAAEQRAEKAEQIVEQTRDDAEFGALLREQPGELRLDAIFSELGLYQGRSPNSTRQWMRDQKHIVKRDGVEMPAARHADAGRFFVRTRKHRRKHEDKDRTHTVIVGTAAGKAWLVREAPDRCWKPGRGPERGQMVIE